MVTAGTAGRATGRSTQLRWAWWIKKMAIANLSLSYEAGLKMLSAEPTALRMSVTPSQRN